MADGPPDARPRHVDVEAATDLCGFIDASPSPFHACEEMARRLDDEGFVALDERDAWTVEPGTTGYVIRDGGTIVAFRVGSAPIAEAGFRLVGAHTDSPTFKVRPHGVTSRVGYGQLSVEVYGGPLAYTWLDRDLGLAGRVVLADGSIRSVHVDRPILRIPSLAIHLNRELNEEGLKLNPQSHIVPLFAAAAQDLGLADLLADHVDGEIIGWDLVLCDTQPSALGGVDKQFLFAPRQDNLVSCYAGLQALLRAGQGDATQVVVCNDHEEVGSGSAEGAAGPMLGDVLGRLISASGDDDAQSLARAVAGSVLISADAAHAVHPNYADKHDGGHRPRLGGGPVIKTHASQAYATDAATLAWFRQRCEAAGVPVQYFSNRADARSGSTIGPLTATRLGLPTVDIGNPLLSMHSIREQSATVDVLYLVGALRNHLTA
ncbi:M18 family aminopeptidase [Euzebya tangerina]|uniref:M18 family aminopeptidase n=1 Tax=Euzebya tangerina TaxID=591198 RepID=UPI000E3169E8|nr:M18 family aminopeptidase [Euzebya tangerina]